MLGSATHTVAPVSGKTVINVLLKVGLPATGVISSSNSLVWSVLPLMVAMIALALSV